MHYVLDVQALELAGRHVEPRAVDLSVEPGEVVGIAGPPGVGKSDFLRALSGQFPARANQLHVLGVDALREPRRVWESVGYLRGDAETFLWRLSARENLRQHAAMKRMPAATLDREVNVQLRRMGLLARSGASPRYFERDDRLRLAMAQAWIDGPRLLLLDDPLHGAGPAVTEQFVGTLDQWLAEDPQRSAVITGRSLRPFIHLMTRALVLRERWLAPIAPHSLP